MGKAKEEAEEFTTRNASQRKLEGLATAEGRMFLGEAMKLEVIAKRRSTPDTRPRDAVPPR